jgi:hypothetical protein
VDYQSGSKPPHSKGSADLIYAHTSILVPYVSVGASSVAETMINAPWATASPVLAGTNGKQQIMTAIHCSAKRSGLLIEGITMRRIIRFNK